MSDSMTSIRLLLHIGLPCRETLPLQALGWALALLLGVLIAQPISAQRCPLVAFGEPGDVRVQCNDDGTASVELKAEVSNPNTDFFFGAVSIECGPGGTKEAGGAIGLLPVPGSQSISATCRYNTPGTPAPFVRSLGPGHEFEEICTETLLVDPLPNCGGGDCPTIQSLQIGTPACSDVIDIQWPVTADAVINQKPDVTGYQWNFGDGSMPVAIPASVPDAPKTTHNYVCPNTGDYFVTLTLFGCPGEEFYTHALTMPIGLPACGCPT